MMCEAITCITNIIIKAVIKIEYSSINFFFTCRNKKFINLKKIL